MSNEENIYTTNGGVITDNTQVVWYTEVCGEADGENRCDEWIEDGDIIPHNASFKDVKEVAIKYFNGDSDFDSEAESVEISKRVNGEWLSEEELEEYDEDKEAREYEGGKEDYLYDNYVAEQLEREDK